MTTNIPKEFIAQFLPNNPVIVEAGAHIGRDTKKMIKVWPHAIIHVFEPVQELFTELQKNVAEFPSIHCHPYALSNKNGTASFHISSGRSTATSSLLQPKEYLQEHPTTQFEVRTIPTITLDTWAQQHAISRVDFLWLDMQGGELLALQGASQLLKTVTAIYTEVNIVERYKHNPTYEEIKQFLLPFGFQVTKEAFSKTWGNVLFVR